jgi:ComF family protein
MLTGIKKAFEKALYPSKCLACRLFFHDYGNPQPVSSSWEYFQKTSLETIFTNEMSSFLCLRCIEDFSPITPPFCFQCGKIFKSQASGNHLCGDCIQKNKPYQRIRSAGMFSGSLMKAIHTLKYAGKIQIAKPLGRLLWGAYIKYFDDIAIDMIIPVPLHASKLRERGFNQAVMMMLQWSEFALELKSNGFQIDFEGAVMNRKKKTESQTGLDRKKRKLNVKGAFSVLRPEAIKGKQILLVDDVYTTGATTDECSKVLMKNGARGVHVLTLSRAG